VLLLLVSTGIEEPRRLLPFLNFMIEIKLSMKIKQNKINQNKNKNKNKGNRL
jgi:hypothetical protein